VAWQRRRHQTINNGIAARGIIVAMSTYLKRMGTALAKTAAKP